MTTNNKWWIVRYWDDDDAHSTIGRFMEECDTYEIACASAIRLIKIREGDYLIIGPENHYRYEGRIMR